MPLFKTTSATDRAFLATAKADPDVRQALAFMRVDAAWESLPKGWTDESAKKFWDSLTGEAKHKVTKCIEKMKGNMDDPGAFCASLADLVDPGWRSRTAALDSPILQWLGKKERLVPAIVKELKAEWASKSYNQGTPPLRDVQALVNGFIHALFNYVVPGAKPTAQKLWRLFEGSGISQDSSGGNNVAYKFDRYFAGPAEFQRLEAAALALNLLVRNRMPNLAARCDAVFQADFKDELGKAPAPAPAGKAPSPNEVLKKLVAERLPAAQKWVGQLKKVGLEADFVTVRTLVADVLEDSNWHSLSNTLSRMTPRSDSLTVPSSLVGEISRSEDYSVNYLAVLGIAMLSVVQDKEGITVLKQAVMSQFPETFEELE